MTDERYTTDQPIFRDAGHALHVAFLIHSLPPTIKSPTAIVIDRLVKGNHVWDELPAPNESRVNFSGLSPQEVRAQCAQVVSMVNHLPHQAERDACQAIYGRQVIKANGVRGMAAYCAPVLGCSDSMALYIAWHVFMRAHQRQGVTMQDIAREFGTNLQVVRYAADIVRKYAVAMHARAIDALTTRFLDGGLILDER